MGALADMARVFVAFERATEMLGQSLDQVHDWIAQAMETNDDDIPGVGHLHRDWRKERTAWSSEPLKRDALQAAKGMTAPHAIDPETGEMMHTWEQAIAAIDRLYNLAGYNARVTAIRDLGLDVRDYATEGQWRPRVSIQPETPAETEQ